MTARRLVAGLLTLVVAPVPAMAAPPTAGAPPLESRADGPETPPRAPHGEDWDAWAWARIRQTWTPAFPIDALGSPNPQTSVLESRLRLGALGRPWSSGASWDLQLALEVDALSGIAAGDFTSLGQVAGPNTLRYRQDQRFGLGLVTLRQGYLALRTPIGQLRAGRQAFSWGTGMLGNSGAGEADFGDRRHGDVVNRVAFATRPLSGWESAPVLVRDAAVFVGGDLVERDDNADRLRGDQAWAAVVGVRTADDDAAIGVLQSFRWQTDRDDPVHPERERTRVEVAATDAHARWTFVRWGSGHSLGVEGEAAVVSGRTTRPYLDETVDGADVLGFGAVARVQYALAPERLSARLELGYASGDNDTHDDTVRTFAFDPDYEVGLVLFDQVLARFSARAVERVSDPTLVAVPPAGVRYLATQGAVTNAAYLNPVVRWEPVQALDLRLGWLLARTAGDLIDPYASAEIGGFNATYGGRSPGSSSLGHEVDAAAHYTLDLGLKTRVGAQAGVLFPGAAFDGTGLGTAWLTRAGLDLWW